MYSPTQKLETPGQYEFPYDPYDIQTELMNSLYAVLEEKNIGIFESPTGTGKSLTLTCAALRWLEDHQKLVREEVNQKIAAQEQDIKQQEAANTKVTDWINAQYEVGQKRSELNELRQLHAWIEDYDQGLTNIKERQTVRKCELKQQKYQNRKKESAKEEINADKEEFEIATSLEKELKDVLETNSPNDSDENSEVNKRFYRDVQIFFCSRTHSQLAQVVREVKSTAYGQRVRCISLGSRQQLCVNPKVKNLSNKALINERCLDLTKKSLKLTKTNDDDGTSKDAGKSSCGCPFKTSNAVQQLAETALVDILDIEDLAIEGTEQKACPYYAARNAATAAAQIIFLPYQTLLHHRTRMRSGINLENAIVIIDEAHNLLDTIADLHSCELNLQHLIQAKHAIQAYKNRYVKLLSTANLLNINQFLYVIRRLINVLEPKTPPSATNQTNCVTRIVHTYQLGDDGDFFNIDLFKLLEFCERTRFAQKLHGFMQSPTATAAPLQENTAAAVKANATVQLLERLQQQETEMNLPKNKMKVNKTIETKENETAISENEVKKDEAITNSTVPIYALISFLEALTEKAEDGRVLIKIDGTPTGSLLRYLVLNPGSYFQDVVRKARAIVISGGTMQPTNELTEQLFRNCPERVRLNFYDHVVSKEAVLPFIVQQGPTGKRLCLNFTHRGAKDMLLELSMIFQNLCQVVPAGLVCFFPSYDYLDKFYEHIRTTNALGKIDSKKRLFRETRAAQSGQSVEQLLKDYAATIKQQGGAILFSVVGGKLSEGLNFKDDLCRGVVVVGMPYANSQSLELKERMNYMNVTLGSGAGNQYYENLCMKSVNQCIGRAVRHINDYAAVYLLDERYSSEHIRKKLPQWIARSLQVTHSFGIVQAKTAKYFKQKRENI